MCLAKKNATFSDMLVGLQLGTPFRFNQQSGGEETGTMSPGSSGEMEINSVLEALLEAEANGRGLQPMHGSSLIKALESVLVSAGTGTYLKCQYERLVQIKDNRTQHL